jgi:hypothetical protein
MSSMFQAGFNRNLFWMGNGGRGGRAVGFGEAEWPYRYCDPSMEPCPTPFVGPVAYPPVGAFAMGQTSVSPGTTYDINDLLNKLRNADNQFAQVVAFMQDPNAKQILGADYDGVSGGVSDVQSKLSADIFNIEQRLQVGLQNPTTVATQISPDEASEVDNYISVAARLYTIMKSHQTAPAAARTGMPPKAPAAAAPAAGPAISPLAIGIGTAAVGILVIAALRG